MAFFTIPNESAIPAQSRVFQSDFDIIKFGGGGLNGVVSGCAVQDQTVPDMSVQVASGSFVSDYVLISLVGDDVAITTANPTNPRFDLIIANDDGTPGVLTGTADPAPVPRSPGTGQVALAQVWVPAAATSITDARIVDKRFPVATPNSTVQGWTMVSAPSDFNINNDATLDPDSVLKFTMAASTKYRFRAMLFVTTLAPSAFKMGITGPASPTFMNVGGRYRRNALAASETQISNVTAYGQLVGNPGGNTEWTFMVEGIVHNGSNASPDFAITIAQGTAVAENTVRRAGSFLEYAVA